MALANVLNLPITYLARFMCLVGAYVVIHVLANAVVAIRPVIILCPHVQRVADKRHVAMQNVRFATVHVTTSTVEPDVDCDTAQNTCLFSQ